MARTSSFFGGIGEEGRSSFDVNDNFVQGKQLAVITRSNLTIPAGEEVIVPQALSMKEFSRYYVHLIVDQDILVTVDWFNSVGRGYVREKVVAIPASSPDGAFLEGRVQGENVSISFVNNAPAGPGSDITFIYLAVFGIR